MANKDPFGTDPWADGEDPFTEMLAKNSRRDPGFVPPPQSSTSVPAAAATDEFLPPPPPPAASTAPSAPSDAPAFETARPQRAANPAVVVTVVLGVIGVVVLVVVGAIFATVNSFQFDSDTYVEPPSTVAPRDIVGDAPAQPGTVVEEASGALEVGVDIAPGVYVAPDAARLAPGECWWTLQGRAAGAPGDVFIYGSSGGFEPLVVLGEGLSFEAFGCGEWVAIDGATAFVGGTTQSFSGDTLAFGGRDLVPGTYLARDSSIAAGECFVQSVDAYAALAGSYGRYGTVTTGGTNIIDVGVGEQVNAFGCGTFTRVNLPQVLALDEGATSFAGEGTFVVGIDVVSGVYGASDPKASCGVTVYPDYLMWESPAAELAEWYDADAVGTIRLNVGEAVYAWGCPAFERVG